MTALAGEQLKALADRHAASFPAVLNGEQYALGDVNAHLSVYAPNAATAETAQDDYRAMVWTAGSFMLHVARHTYPDALIDRESHRGREGQTDIANMIVKKRHLSGGQLTDFRIETVAETELPQASAGQFVWALRQTETVPGTAAYLFSSALHTHADKRPQRVGVVTMVAIRTRSGREPDGPRLLFASPSQRTVKAPHAPLCESTRFRQPARERVVTVLGPYRQPVYPPYGGR